MGDVTGFGLEKEEEIAVLLCSLIVRKESLLGIYSVVEVAGNFVLLVLSGTTHARDGSILTSSRAIRFWISRAIRESKYRTSFSRTKFFFDCVEIFAFSSRRYI